VVDFSVITFSFKRTFHDGKMDLFSCMDRCADMGLRGIDPWSAHLAKLKDPAKLLFTGTHPGQSEVVLDAEDEAFLDSVREHAEKRGLVLGCVAADGPTYIYEPEAWKREACRKLAKRWIDAASRLGARQVRIDPGQWHEYEVPDEVMAILVEGYRDLVAYGRERQVEVLVENHWGCSNHPDVLERLLGEVEGLGMLFDSNNWARGQQAHGWKRCARYARATHIKCLHWADDGEELTQHVGHAVQLLQRAGYQGLWGIESSPADGTDEVEGVARTMKLIEKYLQPAAG
jgi:sugar phosphate isomerase/epimerase